MKKIKYVFGFLLLGVGLLFNQSFAIDVQISTFNSNYTGFNNISYSHLYRFNSLPYDYYYNQMGCLGYGLYYNNNLVDNKLCSSARYCDQLSSNYSSTYFNNSIFSDEFYTGYSFRESQGQHLCYTYNFYSSPFDGVKLLLGTAGNFGKNAIYSRNYIGGTGEYSPKYLFGGYFQGLDFEQLTSEQVGNSIRFFVNSSSNPLGSLNIIDGTGQSNIFAWQYFTNTTTRTNYGYIVDSNGKWKGKHFGSFNLLGYSFVYNKGIGYTGYQVSWSNLGFGTVIDSTYQYWLVGDLSFSDLQSSNHYIDGYLILKKQQYTDNGNEGVIVISKNPNNVKQLLFQEFSCQTNNYSVLFYTGSNGCVVLSQGVLSYNGSTDILPFNDSFSLVNVSSSPLLSYLFDTSSSMLGNTYVNGGQFCIGDVSGNGVCFDKVSTNDSIKENYINGVNTNISTSSLINSSIVENCLSNSDFALRNVVLCNYYQNLFSNTVALGSGYYYQYSLDDSGNLSIEIIDQAGLFEGHTGYVRIQDSSGNWFTNCDGGRCNPNPDNVSGSEYLTGIVYYEGYPWIDSGLMLLSGYFDFEHNSTGLFFKCPFPYNNVIHIGTFDFTFGNFDLLAPINCFISAFNFGKGITVFENVGLYGVGPIMTNGSTSGFSQQYRVLFRFFDFLLCFGLFLMFRFIFKALK